MQADDRRAPWWPVLLAVLAASAVHALYLRAAIANIAYQDYLTALPFVEKFFDGTLTWHDFWEPKAGHRAVLGKVLLLANTVLFKLDTRVDASLGILWMAGMGLVLYQRFVAESRAQLGRFAPLAFVL